MSSQKKPLRHVAIIPDGNRRWAQAQGLSVIEGHKFVAEKIFPRLIAQAIKQQISYLAFWVFSQENWQRSQGEVEGLMQLFKNIGINQLVKNAQQQNAKVRIIGRKEDFSADLQVAFAKAEAETANNQAITVIIALSYSGRDEIVRAVQKIVTELAASPKNEERITIDESTISSHLDTVGIPDPDLIIRTSGEQRLSGFMPWQSTYSEFLFSTKLMPDFTEADFIEATAEYERRQRRFGS